MSKIITIENGEIVEPTNWEQKSKDIIEQLSETLFQGLTQDNTTNTVMDMMGNTKQTKKKYGKDDIMPLIQPVKVTMRLNRLLRVYKPMTLSEAKLIDDTEYLRAFGYYCDIIDYINNYLVYMPDKQTFSAFVNITTDVYNELLVDPNYSQVFKTFEDSFIQTNFLGAQTGMVDSKTTMAKLQTKEAGHNLIKNDSVVQIANIGLDYQQINDKLNKFKSMIKLENKKGNK